MRKFTKQQKQAIKGYYVSRQNGFAEISKAYCLDTIVRAVRDSRNINTFQAIAGTFWFTWKDGTTTTHHESNWWRMKKHIPTPCRYPIHRTT